MTGDARQAEALLTVDLDAVVSNWRLLAAMAGRAECAAVVKADAVSYTHLDVYKRQNVLGPLCSDHDTVAKA